MLLDGGWPRGKADLETVLAYAKNLGIPIFIPEPVELELEEGWLRRVKDHQSAIAASVQAINGHCKEIGEPQQAPRFNDLSILRSGYKDRVRVFKERWGMQTSSFTDVSLKEIHEMSVCRKLPSEDKKDRKSKHFQDVVIYLSVIDHLRKAHCVTTAAFVARDGIFHDHTQRALGMV